MDGVLRTAKDLQIVTEWRRLGVQASDLLNFASAPPSKVSDVRAAPSYV